MVKKKDVKKAEQGHVDDDFSFEETPEEELYPQNKKDDKKDEEVEDEEIPGTGLMSLINQNMLNWMAGTQDVKPDELKKLGDDLANRMNWFLAASAVSMLEGVPLLLKKKRLLEKKLEPEVNSALDGKDIMALHKSISGELKEILEYTRKFIKENKDFLTDNSDFFDRQLFEGIKAMPTELKNDYLMFFTIIEKRGHNLLKQLIKEYRD